MSAIGDYAAAAINNLNGLGAVASEVELAKVATKDKLALALLRISFDHARSIAFLIAHRDFELEGSAFALARPMYETLLRGAWFMYCGDEKSAEHFSTKDEFRGGTLKDTCDSIKACLDAAKYPAEADIFSKVYAMRGTLHSFTHGGMKIVGPYLSGDEVGSSYEDADIRELIDFAEAFAYYCVTYMIELQGHYDRDRAVELSRLIDEQFAI